MKGHSAVWLGLLVAATMMLAGCNTVGEPIQNEAVPRIQKGETTLEEVREIFGNPQRIGVEDGQLTWTYMHYSASIFGRFEGRDLVVKFDNQNRVSSYNYATTDTSEKLKLDR